MANSILIAILILCVALSGMFSASETAFSSCNTIRLKTLEQNGIRKAGKVLTMLEDYDSLLSTILIGNNIVNIAASSIATVLFVRSFGDIGATWSTLVTTLIILVFSEVTPKSIAKERPEKYAMHISGVIHGLAVFLTPLNKLFGWWKNLISRFFPAEKKSDITEREFLTLVDEAESGGGIDKEDSDLIHSVMEFNDLEIGEIYTPRVDIVALPLDAEKEEIARVFMQNEYSRLPVYDETIDNIVGFIHQKDFFDSIYFGKKNMSDILTPVIYIAPTMKISKVLTLLQQEHLHIAVVTDEFGGTDGIVTMEDILEELVGEIYDEHDEVEKDIKETSPGTYLVDCSMELEKFFDFFHMVIPDDVESNSVGGWVLEEFDKIPVRGDNFVFRNHLITVVSTESRRVKVIRVKVQQSAKD